MQRKREPWRWRLQWLASAVDNDQLRVIIKPNPLTTVQEVAQELNVNHSTVIQHLKQIGKVKKLNKRVPHEQTGNQKNFHFEMLSSMQQWELFLDWIMICDWKVDFIWQPAVTSSVVGLRKCHKPLPKAELKPQIGHGHWCLLPVWSTTAFWIPEKPQYLRSMLSKLKRCPENLNACSQHWSTERAQLFSTTTPDCTLHDQCFKSWANWAKKFCLICHIHLTSPTQLPLLQASQQFFVGNMLPQPEGDRKSFPRVCWLLKQGF